MDWLAKMFVWTSERREALRDWSDKRDGSVDEWRHNGCEMIRLSRTGEILRRPSTEDEDLDFLYWNCL